MTKYATLDTLKLSPDVAALNPQLSAKPAKEPKTEARRRLEREIRENFARTFEAVWERNGGPELDPEFLFCADRKWRADYRVAGANVLIELQGGVWTGGRHVRGNGYIEDCIRANAAVLLGYSIISIPTGFATDNYLSMIISFLKEKK